MAHSVPMTHCLGIQHIDGMQDGLGLSHEQTEKILATYEWMHGSILKIMQERELGILPQLQSEISRLPRVRVSIFDL